MYFHSDDSEFNETLGRILLNAGMDERRVRINVNDKGDLSYKVGEGMWCAPVPSDPDPYRDMEQTNEIAVYAEEVRSGDRLTAFGNDVVTHVNPGYSEFHTLIVFTDGDNDGSAIISDCATVTVRRKV